MNMQSNLFCARLMLLCVAPVLCGVSCAIARAQESLTPLTVDVAGQQLVFVRLPDQGDVNLGQETISEEMPITATYLMSTELSSASMKALIGEDEYRAYLGKLMLGPVELSDHKSHKKKLEDATEDIAACSVPVEQVFHCCAKLKELILLSGKISKVETVEVRLPTAAEWKYALLGRDSLDALQQFPRYPDWPTQAGVKQLIAADKTLKGYLSDLQEENELFTIEAFSSQDRFTELLKSATGEKKKLQCGKTVSEILLELQARFLLANTKLGLTSNPVVQGGPRRDYDPRVGVANDFGLLNMYNNLSEWVLLDSATVDADWKHALENPAGCELRFFAIGPSTFARANYGDSWRWMSLRDPFPEDQAGKPKTLSLEEASDPNELQFFEGCRLLVIRRMDKNWFGKLRSEFLLCKDDTNDFGQFANIVETSINEVVTAGPELSQASSRLETYRILAGVSGESERPLSPEFYKLASVGYFVGAESNAEGGKQDAPLVQIDLGDLGGAFGGSSLGSDLKKSLGKDNESSEAASSSQDLDFFSIYNTLIESEAKN